MKVKAFLAAIIAMTLVAPVFGYEEIQCDSDAVFSKYSCNQCFKGNTQSQGDTIGFLSDEWVNDTSSDMIVYKEIQEEPRLINLDSQNVEWGQVPSSEGFWEYTSEFDNLYSEAEDGYVLEAGKKITWIKSKLGYGYQLTKNEAIAGENIGLLVFPLTANALLEDGSISDESDAHNECVLYTSGNAQEETVEVKRLPDTGPAEFTMLAFLAMFLSFALVKMRRQS